MNLDITQYSIEELISLKENIDNCLSSYDDGYFYICEVRSYGRNWSECVSNTYSLQELCYRYNGDEGIVDVFSNNPDLSNIMNYGLIEYVPSKEDYDAWKTYKLTLNLISNISLDLEEWENRDSVPFRNRPLFAPTYTAEDLEEYKKIIENYDMSFVTPKPYEYKKEEY